jgi:hypothetical protein
MGSGSQTDLFMNAATETENDSLRSLEERILKAVELVGQLRRENAALAREKDEAASAHRSVIGDLDSHKTAAALAQAENARLTQEIEAMRAEQKQVRLRLEKLLELIDSVGA